MQKVVRVVNIRVCYNVPDVLHQSSTDGGESSVEFEFDPDTAVITLRKPGVNAGVNWTLHLR